MNTIYSSSDKIVSFLACTCINYLLQAQAQPSRLSPGAPPPSTVPRQNGSLTYNLYQSSRLPFLRAKQVFALKVFSFTKASAHPSFSSFCYTYLGLLWGQNS